MEEEKLIPVAATELEIKPDESLKEETVVLKKGPEVTDSEKEEEKELIIESVDDQVKMNENSTDLVDVLKLKTEEAGEKAEQVLEEIANGASHYSNGVGEKTVADIVNGDSAEESLDAGLPNSVTEVKSVDAEVPIEEKGEEIETSVEEKREEKETEIEEKTEQTEISIEEKTEETENKAEEIAEKIIQISEEKNGSVEESTLRELDEKAEPSETDILVKENVVEKLLANDVIEGSFLTSRAVDLPCKEDIDESLRGEVDESSNVIGRSKEVEISDPPIISVTTRTLRPTSWRNCCGLFEVLRRSDR